jgi:hypothetical protein
MGRREAPRFFGYVLAHKGEGVGYASREMTVTGLYDDRVVL